MDNYGDRNIFLDPLDGEDPLQDVDAEFMAHLRDINNEFEALFNDIDEESTAFDDDLSINFHDNIDYDSAYEDELFLSDEEDDDFYSDDEEEDEVQENSDEQGRRRHRLPNAYPYEFFDVTSANWHLKFLTEDEGVRDRTYFTSARDRFGVFRCLFRMPLHKVDELVNRFLSEGWITYTHHCRSETTLKIKAELLILSCLHILAHGVPFRLIQCYTNISYTEIRKFFHFFLDKMCSIEDEYIYLPRDEDELKDVTTPYKLVSLPGCMGSIDVVHVKWSNCPAGDQVRSKGKESYPSLAFEVVSDQHRRIRGRSRAQFGTRNDKTIVKTDENVRVAREGWYSNVQWTYFDSEGHSKTERGVYYICDNGYCRWKVTICPFKHFNSTSPEGQWSDNLESVRKDVECCFGILKKRWRIIDYGLKFRSMELCEKVFVSCCILHNMMVDEVVPNPHRVNRGNFPHPGDGIWIEGASTMMYESNDNGGRSESTKWGQRRQHLVDHFMFIRRSRVLGHHRRKRQEKRRRRG